MLYRPDGQLVHRSLGEAFDLNTTRIWTASMLTVQLVETTEGIEVGVRIEGAVVTSISATCSLKSPPSWARRCSSTPGALGLQS